MNAPRLKLIASALGFTAVIVLWGQAILSAPPPGKGGGNNEDRPVTMTFRDNALDGISRKAGVEPWPRLFQNLRASRETELANSFPLHVVTSWLGNTPSVADRHYLQVTSEHFAQAVAGRGARVVQQVVQKPAAGDCNQMRQSTKALGLMAI